MSSMNEATNANAVRRGGDAARQVADWKFVRLLGKGGAAEVFEVENVRLGTRAAIKLFSCAKDKDGEVRTRFLAEAALLARLNHPRLVRVFDYGIDPVSNRPYFVMDIILDPSGVPKTLADNEFGGADEDHVAMWYDDIRDALAYIHARGIVHRDIKLQNVLVGPDGHAVLSDFGIAKIFDTSLRQKVGLSPEATLLAAKGRRTVMGSLGYFAPELEMGMAASPASDYYALGVLVFFLLTGTWCEPRTDLESALRTYDPVWREVLPKLLHANPSARECLSWRECAMRNREAAAARAEDEIDDAESNLKRVRRGRQIATIVAVVLGIAFLAVAALILFRPPPLATVDICDYPPDVPKDIDTDKEYLFAARGHVCDYVAKINRREMSPQAAAEELRHRADDPSLDDPVAYLLRVSADNLLRETHQ